MFGEAQLHGFQGLLPEVCKMSPSILGLITLLRWRQKSTKWAGIFLQWRQKSTKWAAGRSIGRISGTVTRSVQNETQDVRFDHFGALAPEVSKTSPTILVFSSRGTKSPEKDPQDAQLEKFNTRPGTIDQNAGTTQPRAVWCSKGVSHWMPPVTPGIFRVDAISDVIFMSTTKYVFWCVCGLCKKVMLASRSSERHNLNFESQIYNFA